MSVLNTALASLAVLILVLQSWVSAENKWVIIGAGIAGLAVAVGMDARVTLRPENLLFVAMAATIALFEIRNKTHNNTWLYPIPMIGFVMSNLHPSVIILIATVCCYLVQDIFKGRSWVAAKPLLVVVIASSVAAMVTPFGPIQLLLPFVFATDAALTGQVVEFFPILATPLAPVFIVTFISGIVAFIPKPRALNEISNGLLFILFSILTFRYSRNVGLFAIAAFNPLSHLVMTALLRAESTISKKRAGVISCLAALAVMMSLLAWHRYAMHAWELDSEKVYFLLMLYK